MKEEIFVVDSLPKNQVREGLSEDGKKFQFVTRDEALTEILKTIRELKKGITG